jgi:methylglutaconyl-CoA hydratase
MNDMSTAPAVLIERSGGVLTFTLNNPGLGNEIAGPMFDAMMDELASQSRNPTERVLRIRATGEKFCSGRERAGQDPVSIHAEVSRLIEFKRMLRSTSLITIAEVQGDAHGFGFGLAILCDFTVVASHARLAFPEMRKGLAPAAIMAYLGDYALPKAAFPLVLFGDDITPELALTLGLVTSVCEAGQLATTVDALARRIMGLDPTGARQCKAYFQSAAENSLDSNFKLAVEQLTVTTLRLKQNK